MHRKYKNIFRVIRFGVIFLAIVAMVSMQYKDVFAAVVDPVSGAKIFSSGGNWSGQIGNNVPQYQMTAERYQLPAGLSVKEVVQMRESIFVLASDNQLYGAGNNADGELGIGDVNFRSVPTRFQLPPGVSVVSVHTYPKDYIDYDTVMMVLGSDGQVYGAGSNYYGQLGNRGGQIAYSTPVRFQLPAGLTALELVVGYENVFVRASDGNVYGAGRNKDGELGDGTTTQANTPVRFGLPAGVQGAKLAQYHQGIYISNGYVIGSDGKLYGAGANTGWSIGGNLGNGTVTDQYTPVKYILPAGAAEVVPEDSLKEERPQSEQPIVDKYRNHLAAVAASLIQKTPLPRPLEI